MNSWTQVASLPTAHFGLAAATGGDGRIYAIGGVGNAGSSNEVDAYDPVTNSWTQVASLPTARFGLAAATGGDGRIYAIGGNANTGSSNEVDAYNPATNAWAQVAALPNARYSPAAAVGGDGRIYAIGGNANAGNSNEVDAITPALSGTTSGSGTAHVMAAPTLSLSGAGGTYNGSAFAATASVAGMISGVDTTPGPTLEGVALTLAYYAGTYTSVSQTTGVTPLSGAPSFAGPYTVVATYPGSADYFSATALVNFSITKATPAVSVADAGGVYNGTDFAATDTVAGIDGHTAANLEGLAPELDYLRLNSDGSKPANLGGDAPIIAGSYEVIATFAGSDDYLSARNFITFTITQATPTVSVTDVSGTYSGSPYPAVGSVSGVTTINGTPEVLGMPTFIYYVNTGTGASPVWTQIDSTPVVRRQLRGGRVLRRRHQLHRR